MVREAGANAREREGEEETATTTPFPRFEQNLSDLTADVDCSTEAVKIQTMRELTADKDRGGAVKSLAERLKGTGKLHGQNNATVERQQRKKNNKKNK